MRETYHHATAEAIREGLLDAVSLQCEAESIADTLAESLAGDFELPDREWDDVAEVLAHVASVPTKSRKPCGRLCAVWQPRRPRSW